jgi:N-acetylmuramoyl-L-alanine amidase
MLAPGKLLNRGVAIFMTRPAKAAASRRSNHRAQQQGCDVFLSFHLNDAEMTLQTDLVLFRNDVKDKPLASRLQTALIGTTAGIE